MAKLERPEWPVWPQEADAGFHAWVRDHWTVEASDEFDLQLEEDLDLLEVEREELCFRLIEQRDEPEAVRETLAERGYPLWPDEYEQPWYKWYMRWPPVPLADLSHDVAEFVRLMWNALHTWRDYTPDTYERAKRRPRLDHEEKWGRPHEELLAEMRERRTWGARGCYRITGSMWEAKNGITAADIDAP